MKHDKALLWTEVLRSGQLEQNRDSFYKNGKVCVLGALCLVAMSEGVCDFTPIKNGYGLFDGASAKLPKSVVEWAGMSSRTGTVPGEFLSLSGLNDLAEWDFLQLAQVIEENYEQL